MTHRLGLLSAMLATVALITGALLLDVQREFEAAVQAMRDEQIALATAVGADFESRLARLEDGREHGPGEFDFNIPKLLGGAMELEQRGSRILLIAKPGQLELLTTHGLALHSPTLEAAFAARSTGVVVPREESPALGLPARIAIAGIKRAHGREGDWGIMVVVSAERLRARERYAQWRFLLGLGLVTVLVSGFGMFALREQRRKLEVARKLEVSALERDRERLLAKADKMATLAALSSGIAHEVATPLGTIVARVEQVLPAVAEQPKASAALRVVLEQVERIQGIIRGVLGLARGELPSPVHTKPQAIARAAVALISHRFGEAGVRIEVDVPANLREIACDPPMLEQTLANLLLNACDASARGASVSLSAYDEQGKLCFVVEDEGEGISPETALRAREAFFTTKPKGSGTGLGLAIAQEVVAHHRGKLTLQKREHVRGTRAVIELPQA